MKLFIKKILKKILNLLGNDYYVDKFTEIGKYTFIGKEVSITKSKIGNYCSIAPGTLIGVGEHDINEISTNSIFYENEYEKLTEKECIIGHDVWLGTNVVVLRGVEIGIGAVIGAGAIVTKDVPSFAVAVGVPARIIKYRFPKNKQEVILSSKWWEFDKNDAYKIIKGLE